MAECGSCGDEYEEGTSAWDLCLPCLIYSIDRMTPAQLADTTDDVLELVKRAKAAGDADA